MNETLFLSGRPVGLGACPVVRPEGIYLNGVRVIRIGMEGVGLAAMERANPLPPGKYWVDVFPPNMDAFSAWTVKNAATVHVDASESFSGSTDNDPPPRDWWLFTVSAPTTWEGPGFPTIATPDIHSSSDTVQRPPPTPNPLDQINPPNAGDLVKQVADAAKIVLIVGAVVVGGVLVIRYLPKPAASAPRPTY